MGSWLSIRFCDRIGRLPPYLQLRPLLRTLRGFNRGVPALLGLVLLAAAALKARQFATSLNAGSGLFTSRWSLIGLIELELALGLCLLVGLYPRQIRLTALICFTTFAAVSLQQAIAGKASCSCFGALAVRPWYTFLLDLIAVAALWHWQPEQNVCSEGGGTRHLFPASVFHSLPDPLPSGWGSRVQRVVAAFYPAFGSLS